MTALSVTRSPDRGNLNYISFFERAPADLAARHIASKFGIDLRIATLIAALASLGEAQQ